jgi:hypothetical protein
MAKTIPKTTEAEPARPPPAAETDGALALIIVVAAGMAGVLVMALLAAFR